MAIIPLGFSQVTWIFQGGPVPNGAVTTLGIEVTNEDGQAANAESLYNSFADHLLPNLTTALNLVGALLKDGPNDIGSSVLYSESTGGGSGSNAVPPNVSVLLSKNTLLGGRKNRGRMYLPGYREDSVDNGGNITADLTEFRSDVEAFYDELVTNGLSPVVLHNDESTPTDIASFTLQSVVATQRRRLRR